MIKKNVIYLIIIAIIYGIIYNRVVISKFKDKVNEDWRYYRCQPYILPISGLFRTEKNQGFLGSTFTNFKKCNWVTLKKYFAFLISPFRFIISIITVILQKFKNTINIFRKQLKIMRNFLFGMMKKIMERIQNISSGLVYLISKMRETMKRSYANYKLLNHYTTTTNYTLRSIMEGPIGQVGKYAMAIGIFMIAFFPGPVIGAPFIGVLLGMCFDPDTLVKMNDETYRKISDIKLGQELEIGGKVTSIYQISLRHSEKDMFDYLGTLVSGSHLVLEHNQWIRVEDSELSQPINYTKNILICLNTQYHTIGINNTIFRDFRETSIPNVNLQIDRMIMKYLNSKDEKAVTITENDIEHQYDWGFDGNTPILMHDGTQKTLNTLALDDKTLYNGYIQALIIHEDTDITFYQYCPPNETNYFRVSGSQAVYEEGKWIRVHQSKYASKYTSKSPIYHVVTTSGFLTLHNTRFTDYYECKDDNINTLIDNLVTENLNKSFVKNNIIRN